MADLGLIGRRLVHPKWNLSFPLYAISGFPAIRQDGTLSGTVLESGLPVAGVRVLVMYRKSGLPIGAAFTNAAGAWSVGGLNPDTPNAYAVWIQDKEGGTVYNDAIFASIVPT
jgi:hypothetical protein